MSANHSNGDGGPAKHPNSSRKTPVSNTFKEEDFESGDGGAISDGEDDGSEYEDNEAPPPSPTPNRRSSTAAPSKRKAAQSSKTDGEKGFRHRWMVKTSEEKNLKAAPLAGARDNERALLPGFRGRGSKKSPSVPSTPATPVTPSTSSTTVNEDDAGTGKKKKKKSTSKATSQSSRNGDFSGNGRVEGRNLIPWHRPRMMEKLIMCIDYECSLAGIRLPWNAAVSRLNPGSSGEAAKQFLTKERDKLIAEGHLVPPLPSSGKNSSHKIDKSVRGYVREENNPSAVRTLGWKEKYVHPRKNRDTGIIYGSGNYRKAQQQQKNREDAKRMTEDNDIDDMDDMDDMDEPASPTMAMAERKMMRQLAGSRSLQNKSKSVPKKRARVEKWSDDDDYEDSKQASPPKKKKIEKTSKRARPSSASRQLPAPAQESHEVPMASIEQVSPILGHVSPLNSARHNSFAAGPTGQDSASALDESMAPIDLSHLSTHMPGPIDSLTRAARLNWSNSVEPTFSSTGPRIPGSTQASFGGYSYSSTPNYSEGIGYQQMLFDNATNWMTMDGGNDMMHDGIDLFPNRTQYQPTLAQYHGGGYQASGLSGYDSQLSNNTSRSSHQPSDSQAAEKEFDDGTYNYDSFSEQFFPQEE